MVLASMGFLLDVHGLVQIIKEKIGNFVCFKKGASKNLFEKRKSVALIWLLKRNTRW